jgi:hypothetical protein
MTDFVVSSAIVSISEIQLHVNGNSATAISITDNLKVNSYYVDIGARYNGSSNYFYGDICEIIAYNSALSDPDRQSVESYLNNKWAIY